MQAGIAKRMLGRTPREALACVATLVLIAACKSADQSATVPLTLRDNAAFVVVDIDGDKVPLQLDTGNSESITLTEAAMTRVKAQPIGGTSKGMDAKGNLLESRRFKIPRLQMGTADFVAVVASLDVHHATYPANEIGQQGFLGTALFEPYQVLLDYPQQTMTLMSSGAGCEGTAVPFTPGWNGQPVTLVDTDLGELVVWWDTGAPVSILSKRFVQKTSQSSPEKVTSKRLTLGGADFGPWSFEVWDVSLPPGFDGFIGNDFFAAHIVCMDFPGDRLLIRKATH